MTQSAVTYVLLFSKYIKYNVLKTLCSVQRHQQIGLVMETVCHDARQAGLMWIQHHCRQPAATKLTAPAQRRRVIGF